MNPLPSKKQKLEEDGSDEEEIDIGSSSSSSDDDDDLDDDDEEEEGGSDGDSDTPADGIVNVEFEGIPPVDEDYESIKKLLDQLFRGLLINTSKLSDLVIEMQEFSTVLKDQNSEDNTVFAVASVINLSKPFNAVALEAAHEFRGNVLASYAETNEAFDADLKRFQVGGNNNESVFGLIVLEKIVNIPEQVAWQMLTTLKEDIDLDDTEFSHFFLLTKRYRVGAETYPIEEYFDALEEFATSKIDLDLPDNVDTIQHNHGAGKPFRRLLLYKASDFYQAIQSKMGD